MTIIKDKITYYDGSVATGKIVVTWPPFDYGGVAIAAGQQEYPIAPDGSVLIECLPCVGAQPIGTYYTATYELDKGATYDEYWLVPSTSSTTIGAIRVSVPETPSIMINAQQLTNSGAQSGMFLGWSGSGWVPMYPSSFNCAVRSFFGRTGDVMPLTGDYTVEQVTNAVPDARRVIAGSGLTGGGPLTADVTISLSAGGFVPPSRQIIAGYGLAGGGPLTGDVTLSVVTGMFALQATRVIAGSGLTGGGPLTGDVTLSIPAGTTVPPSTQVIAGFGLTGGGPLSGNVTLSVVNNASVQKLQLALAGVLKATRHQLNFVAGSGVNLNLVDDGASLDQGTVTITAVSTGAPTPSIYSVNGVQIGSQVELNLIASTGVTLAGVNNNGAGRVDITVSMTAGGGQTPWLSNIDGGGHDLYNVAGITATSLVVTNETVTTLAITGTAYINTAIGTPGYFGYYSAGSPRWLIGKSSDAEGGSNSGSNFVLFRYDDAGGYLGWGMMVTRANGNITLQGDVTISKPVTGMVSYSLTSFEGVSAYFGALSTLAFIGTFSNHPFWIYANGSPAVYVMPNGSVGIAVSPAYKLDIAGDCNLSSGSVYRINGVPLAAASVGAVPTTRQVIAGTGLTGGGALSADVTLAAKSMVASGASHSAGMVPDPGATAGTTRFLREDATWAVLSAGASQTPWTQDIDGAGFRLKGTGSVGIGNDASLSFFGISPVLFVGKSTPAGSTGHLVVVGNFSASNSGIGYIHFYNNNLAAAEKRIAYIGAITASSADSGSLIFNTYNAGVTAEVVRMTAAGFVGIGTTAPATALDVAGVMRSTAGVNPTSGAGLELSYQGGTSYVISYDRTAGVFKPVNIAGLTIELSGNVGIGTIPNSSYKLHVYSSSIVQSVLESGDSAGSGYVIQGFYTPSYKYEIGAGATGSGFANKFYVFDRTASATRMLFDSAGNCGLGTASPNALLHLNRDPSGPGAIGAAILLYRAGSNLYGGAIWATYLGDGLDRLQFGVGNNLSPTSNPVMTIMVQGSGGNVGIGLSSPVGKCQVEHPAGTLGFFASNSIATWGTTTNFNNHRFFKTYSAATDGVFKETHIGPGGIAIGYSGTPTYGSADAMLINGNVAIGVTGAFGALHVSSAVTASSGGIVISNGGSTDHWKMYCSAGQDMFYLGYNSIGVGGWYNGNIPAISLSYLNSYVGIRKTNPGFAMDVVGDVNCTGRYLMAGGAFAVIRTQYNVTASRALGSVYQNNNPYPIFVSVYAIVNSGSYLKLLSDGGNPPSVPVFVATNTYTNTAGYSACGFVMQGHFYKIETPGASLTTWVEWA